MPTESENIEYVKDRIATFEASAEVYRTLADSNPEYRAVGFRDKVTSYETVATALGHVLYYMENGQQHPDLGVPVAEIGITPEAKVQVTPAAKPGAKAKVDS